MRFWHVGSHMGVDRFQLGAVAFGLGLAEVVGCQLAAPPDPAQRSVDLQRPEPSSPTPDPGPSMGDPAGGGATSPEAYRSIPEHTAWGGCAELPLRDPSRTADTVRAVDWCTRSYGAMADLRDGYHELREYEDLGGPHDTTVWRLRDVGYGDIDGDGLEEAAILISDETYGATGGSAGRTTVYLYALRDGAVVELARGSAPPCDRATMAVEAGAIRIAYEHEGESCHAAWALPGATLELADPSCVPSP